MKHDVAAAGVGDRDVADLNDDESDSLRRQIESVRSIRLIGAPSALLLDTWALLTPEGQLPPSLRAKLRALQGEGTHIVVLADEPTGLREALVGLPALVAPSFEDARLDGPLIAILAEVRALPPGTHAWYVGGDCPGPPFRACRLGGPGATEEILGLLGTAMVQERAGIAFRAAGAGRPLPGQAQFDPGILKGIAAAVTSHPVRLAQSDRIKGQQGAIDLDRETDALLAALFPPLLQCQAPNGAIAGAHPPDRPDGPNYWFFWQRDAGQVAIAVADLVREDGPYRNEARHLLDGYVRFVRELPQRPEVGPNDLGVSRFTMEGRPVRTYGNPQNDGPAHTVLALAAILGDAAYDPAGPYLEYLWRCRPGPCFDPWEFAVADNFFDFNLARRALSTGARLAAAVGERSAAQRYGSKADDLARDLEAFMAPEEGYIRAGRDFLQPLFRPMTHLDISVVGSILTAYDVADPLTNVDHPLVVGTMHGLERASAERWPVNIAWQRDGHAGMGMARFPEDANDGIGVSGGNPWTFATLWAAQFYLRAIERLQLSREDNAAGFRRTELLERADGYLRFVLSHMPAAALTEQIDGQTGEPRGARRLAWAHAAAIDTLLLRRRLATATQA